MKQVIFGGFIFLTGGIMLSASVIATSFERVMLGSLGPILMILGFILGIIGFFVPGRKIN